MKARHYITTVALLAALTLAPVGAEEKPESTMASSEQSPLFAFHNLSGLNLHHFLYWQVYLDGKASMDEAVRAMVERLTADTAPGV